MKLKLCIKKVFTLLVMIAMVVGTNMVVSATELPTDVTTPSTGNVLVTMEGEYSTNGKDAILTELNRIRKEACDEGVEDPRQAGQYLKSSDYVPIKWSKALEQIAQIRAGEQGINGLNHSRPNGDAFGTWINKLKFDSKQTWGENLAGNYSSTPTKDAIGQWYTEKTAWVNKTGEATGHYTAIINPNNTFTGLMTFYSGKGFKYTAQEFSYEGGLDETEVGKTGTFSQVVEVAPSTLTITMSGADELQPAGTSTYELSAVATKVGSAVEFKTPIVWSSSDTSKATINSSTGVLTAKADGTTTVKATCNNVVLATKEVTVKSKTITGISVSTWPTKDEYIKGQNFDPTGGKITVTYDDLTTGQVDLSDATISGYDKNTVGEQTLTATYGGKTATFKVTVIDKAATKIEVTTKPKVTYIEGQDFDPTGGKVTITYNDDSTQEVALTSSMVSGYDKNTTGEQTLTVSTAGKTTTLKVNVSEKQVSGIVIKTAPTKKEYVVGQTNDVTGGVITVTYDNGTTADVDITSSMVSGFDSSAPATNQVLTVTYGGKTATYKVNIVAKKVTSIKVTTPPTKTEYIEGQDIDVTGGKLTATYNDGSTKEVAITSSMLSGYNKNTIGTQSVTVTYEGKTDTFNVKVVAKKVSSIAVKTNPAKMTYKEGKDSLDLSGGELEVIYDNGTTATIAMNATGVSNSGFDNTKVGSDTITFTYEGKTTTLPVTIEAKKVESIEATAPTKTTYVKGQSIDVAGGKVKVNYDNDTNETIDMTSSMLSDYDPNNIATQHVTVTYEGKEDTFDVTVLAKIVDSIKMKTNPTKVTYKEGKDLDLTGGKITATFNDSTTADIDLSSCTVTGYDKTTPGSQELTVTYEGKTTKFNVTVEAKAIESIEMKSKPTKLTYKEGQDLDLTGGVIKVNYDNDTTKDVTITADMISGYDKTKTGSQTVTVTYEGKTTTFDVTVSAKKVDTVRITTKPSKVSYVEGQDLDTTGGKLLVTYDNGETKTIDITTDMVSGYDKTVPGLQALTVTYEGKSDTYNVDVVAKTVTGIAMKTNPTKVQYIVNQPFDISGATIEVTYNDGEKKTVAVDDTMFVAPDTTTLGDKTVNVSYKGQTTSFGVKVVDKTLASIAVTTKPTTLTYVEGGTLDPTGGVITLTYDNGSTETVNITSGMCKANMNKVGAQDVTVTYNGKTATYPITINAKKPVSMTWVEQPTINNVVEGLNYPFSGTVEITYDNGAKEQLPVTADMFEAVDYDKDQLGDQNIEVQIKGTTIQLPATIKVVEKSQTGIKFESMPTLSFKLGDTFNLDGLKVVLTYDNNTTKEIPLSALTISTPDMNKLGEQTITVEYDGYTISYKIGIIKATDPEVKPTPNKPTTDNKVQTGDDVSILGYMLLMLISSLIVIRRKITD